MEIIAISFTIAAIFLFLYRLLKWSVIISVCVIAIIIWIIYYIFSSASYSKKVTDEEVAQYIKETEENFIRASKKYILEFIEETNPTIDINRKYTDDELNELKSRLEKNKINIPRLERYMKYSPNTKIYFLKDLIKEEIKKKQL